MDEYSSEEEGESNNFDLDLICNENYYDKKVTTFFIKNILFYGLILSMESFDDGFL